MTSTARGGFTPTVRYLSRPEVAARIGVKTDTLNRYKLPAPDAQIGARQIGWLPETIDAWNAARPSRTREARE
jgi:predicted DNA-binding transcriptional regulator AlpA